MPLPQLREIRGAASSPLRCGVQFDTRKGCYRPADERLSVKLKGEATPAAPILAALHSERERRPGTPAPVATSPDVSLPASLCKERRSPRVAPQSPETPFAPREDLFPARLL